MANVLGNDMLAGAVGSAAKQFGDQHLSRVSSWFSMEPLQYYFTVDTPYVLLRLRRLLMPFLPADSWARAAMHDGKALPPRQDPNAPDLYVPVMAFVTFLLVAGLSMGTRDRFSPEALGMLASSMLGWLCLEVLLYYVMVYAFNIQNLGLLDLCAYSGYKYVG